MLRAIYLWLTKARRARLAEEARQRRIWDWQLQRIKDDLEAARQWCETARSPKHRKRITSPNPTTPYQAKPQLT